jgi:hypothetical protein
VYVAVCNVAAAAWAILASFQVTSDAIVTEGVPAARRVRLRQHFFANGTLHYVDNLADVPVHYVLGHAPTSRSKFEQALVCYCPSSRQIAAFQSHDEVFLKRIRALPGFQSCQ